MADPSAPGKSRFHAWRSFVEEPRLPPRHEGGFVGLRRGYLSQLPENRFEPLHVHEQSDVGPVVAVCEEFWLYELLFEILDTLLCAVLVVYTIYIGYSHTQCVINGEGMLSRGHGPSKGSKPGIRV